MKLWGPLLASFHGCCECHGNQDFHGPILTELLCPIWNSQGLISLAESSQVWLQLLCLLAGKAGRWRVRVCRKVTAGGTSPVPTHFLKQCGKEHISICQRVKCRKQYFSFTAWCVEERKCCLSTQKKSQALTQRHCWKNKCNIIIHITVKMKKLFSALRHWGSSTPPFMYLTWREEGWNGAGRALCSSVFCIWTIAKRFLNTFFDF